jgi:trigger factor
VPAAVLKRYFSGEAIKEAAVARLAPDAVTEAVQQAGLIVVDISPIRDVQIEEGEALRFRTTLDVRPKPRLGQYKGLSLVRRPIEVTHEHVQRELEQMRESASAWLATDRKQVRKGDRVFADITVKVEGEEPMSDMDVGFHVGVGRTEPPIDEGMIGAEVGSTIDIQTRYPDDFDDEDLAGKPAVATVTINRLEEHQQPELNDEFARENYGFETLEELRADVRARLEAAAEEEAESALKEQALAQAVEAAEVEIPKRLAQEGAEARLQDLASDVRHYGMRYEDLLRASRATEEQMRARLARSSEQLLKRFFVVEAIAEAEGIEVSEEEVEAELKRMAEEQGRPVGAVREELEKEERIGPLRWRLREQKVLNLLVESANVAEAAAEAEQEPASEPDEAEQSDRPVAQAGDADGGT